MVFIDIIESFCEELGMDSAEVLGKDKNAKLWNARYLIYYHLHFGMGLSANRIAKIFDRDRVNIFRGIRLIKHQMKYDNKLREKYYNICAKIEDATAAAPSGDI